MGCSAEVSRIKRVETRSLQSRSTYLAIGILLFRLFVNGGSNQGNGTTVANWIHDTTGAFLRLDAEL